MVCVVRVEGTPYLCQTDEVGEICVSSGSTGVAYYGLPGMTKNVFEVSSFIPPSTSQHDFYFSCYEYPYFTLIISCYFLYDLLYIYMYTFIYLVLLADLVSAFVL